LKLSTARRVELAGDRLGHVQPLVQIAMFKRVPLPLRPACRERRAEHLVAPRDAFIEEALPAGER
jgi:hypothetical protein